MLRLTHLSFDVTAMYRELDSLLPHFHLLITGKHLKYVKMNVKSI